LSNFKQGVSGYGNKQNHNNFNVVTGGCRDSRFCQKAGQSAKISTGVVETAQQVKLQSEAGTGALVGGGLGLLSASGKSKVKGAQFHHWCRCWNRIAGSQGNRNGMQYTVRTSEGSWIRVVTDQTEIRVGDCVAVREWSNRERTASGCYRSDLNLRKRQQLQGSFQQEASECAMPNRRC
jgi:hypothetical protein